MFGLQPLSAFSLTERDPALEDIYIAKIRDSVGLVDMEWIWAVEITPYQPGETVVFPDDDVKVEVSWLQLEVPA